MCDVCMSCVGCAVVGGCESVRFCIWLYCFWTAGTWGRAVRRQIVPPHRLDAKNSFFSLLFSNSCPPSNFRNFKKKCFFFYFSKKKLDFYFFKKNSKKSFFFQINFQKVFKKFSKSFQFFFSIFFF